MVTVMEQKEKQEFILIMRTEMREVFDLKLGILQESIDDKLALVLEVIDDIHKMLDERTEIFKEIFAKFDTKADVEEVDALDRRVTKLEEGVIRPSRSG